VVVTESDPRCNNQDSAVYASGVITIREKFGDLSCLVSKAKDNRMVLFYK